MTLLASCAPHCRILQGPGSSLRRFAVIAGLALLLAVVGGCGGGGDGGTPSSTTGSTIDITPPTFAGATGALAQSTTSITVSWNAAADNITPSANIVYLIYRATTPGAQNYATPTAATAAGVISYTDSGLTSGATYYYVMRAKDEAGNIDSNSVQVTATTILDGTPPTFSGVTGATASSTSSIAVGWSAATDDITSPGNISYLIYRATTSGGHNFATPTATTPPGVLSFTNSGLASGTPYYYVVRARDEAGNIDTNTVQVTATTLAALDTTPPTFAGASSLTIQSGTSMTISWNAAADNVTSSANMVYLIYRATAPNTQNFTAPFATAAAGANSYVDSNILPATKYYYVVRARDQAGNQDSNTAEVFGPVSFLSDIYNPLMAGTCTGCHSAAQQSGGLDLSTAAKAYADLVGVAAIECTSTTGQNYVTAGSSSTSYLVNKLAGTGLCSGVRMPFGGPFFTTSQINAVRAWIDQGAPNN